MGASLRRGFCNPTRAAPYERNEDILEDMRLLLSQMMIYQKDVTDLLGQIRLQAVSYVLPPNHNARLGMLFHRHHRMLHSYLEQMVIQTQQIELAYGKLDRLNGFMMETHFGAQSAVPPLAEVDFAAVLAAQQRAVHALILAVPGFQDDAPTNEDEGCWISLCDEVLANQAQAALKSGHLAIVDELKLEAKQASLLND